MSNPPIKQKYIPSSELMWQYFTEYVEHERLSPMYKVEYVGKEGTKVDTPLQVPITFEGFECYLADRDIICHLSAYVTNKDGAYDSYVSILTRIRQNCFVQNFKGASVGLFNANIIARKLHLKEQQEIEANVKIEQITGMEIK